MTSIQRLDRFVPRTPAWLDRFVEPQLIRRRGVIDHVACRDLETGERRLVIATDDAGACRLLDEIARFHGELRHPNIPALDHRGSASGTEYVSLRSGAVADLDTLLPVGMSSGGMSPTATVAFIDAVIAAIRAAHATRDSRTGGPICIGAFSGVNVLVSDTNRVEVIGWGYPATETDRRVVMRDPTVMHVAWEASYDARCTEKSDLDAVGRFFHAMLPAAALPPIVIAALRGEMSDSKTVEIVRLIARLEHSAHARDPNERSWDVYLDTLHRIIAMLEVAIDDQAELERELGRVLGCWRSMSHLCSAHDGSWFTLDGTHVELDRRQNLRRVMAALVARRRAAPGVPIASHKLLAEGWPGERVAIDSGRNRVRVAVSTLRSLGLRDVLLSRDDGYMLDPQVALEIE